MATLRTGNFATDYSAPRIKDLDYLTVASVSTTTFVANFSGRGAPNDVYTFSGNGLGASNLYTLTGSITAVREVYNGQLVFEVSGFSISAQTFFTWIGINANASMMQAIFGGRDEIFGGSASDVLRAYAGNDVFHGGAGYDTAVVETNVANTVGYHYGDEAVIRNIRTGETDLYDSIEAFKYTDGTYPVGTLGDASPLQYIASYGDLMAAYGANAQLGWQHLKISGIAEGRQTTFSGASYIASYTDLMNALGANGEVGASHYIEHGRAEGRGITFSGLEYIASYKDLTATFKANADAGASHYITSGRAEGREITFDGLEYIASYGDLIKGLAHTGAAGAQHYLTRGVAEKREVTYDAYQYVASYGDLIKAFGTNKDGALEHWLNFGFKEGRAADDFNAAQYLANYADLRAAYGTDQAAATLHFINFGYTEHRSDELL